MPPMNEQPPPGWIVPVIFISVVITLTIIGALVLT
jgi:hypothetical protein